MNGMVAELHTVVLSIKRRLPSCLARLLSEHRGSGFFDLINRRFTCGMVYWDSATARSGVLSSRYSSAGVLPKSISHPCRRPLGWRMECRRDRKRSHPKPDISNSINLGSIEGWGGGQTRCFPAGISLSQTTLSRRRRRGRRGECSVSRQSGAEREMDRQGE